MNERERLVELINQAIDTYATMPLVNGCRPELKYFLADHLLANGVIVPPCKVGTAIYFIEEDISCVWKGEIVSWSPQKDGLWFNAGYYCGLKYWHKEEDLGKTVFLTREEAEKALAERNKE